MNRQLTERQRAIWAWIREYTQAHGYAPTVREIADGLGINSTNGVADHLRALRRKGAIVWRPGCPRTIRVVEVQS